VLPKSFHKISNLVVKNFVGACLQWDPSARPTAGELLQHPFLSDDSHDGDAAAAAVAAAAAAAAAATADSASAPPVHQEQDTAVNQDAEADRLRTTSRPQNHSLVRSPSSKQYDIVLPPAQLQSARVATAASAADSSTTNGHLPSLHSSEYEIVMSDADHHTVEVQMLLPTGGGAHNVVKFSFNLKTDTPLEVANEMVSELELPEELGRKIADAIRLRVEQYNASVATAAALASHSESEPANAVAPGEGRRPPMQDSSKAAPEVAPSGTSAPPDDDAQPREHTSQPPALHDFLPSAPLAAASNLTSGEAPPRPESVLGEWEHETAAVRAPPSVSVRSLSDSGSADYVAEDFAQSLARNSAVTPPPIAATAAAAGTATRPSAPVTTTLQYSPPLLPTATPGVVVTQLSSDEEGMQSALASLYERQELARQHLDSTHERQRKTMDHSQQNARQSLRDHHDHERLTLLSHFEHVRKERLAVATTAAAHAISAVPTTQQQHQHQYQQQRPVAHVGAQPVSSVPLTRLGNQSVDSSPLLSPEVSLSFTTSAPAPTSPSALSQPGAVPTGAAVDTANAQPMPRASDADYVEQATAGRLPRTVLGGNSACFLSRSLPPGSFAHHTVDSAATLGEYAASVLPAMGGRSPLRREVSTSNLLDQQESAHKLSALEKLEQRALAGLSGAETTGEPPLRSSDSHSSGSTSPRLGSLSAAKSPHLAASPLLSTSPLILPVAQGRAPQPSQSGSLAFPRKSLPTSTQQLVEQSRSLASLPPRLHHPTVQH
jgi:hypothetical protein